MRAWIVSFVAAVGLSFGGLSHAAEPIKAQVVIAADKPGARIDRNIYGHFVEHLGRGVYEGIWVGEDSSIPNTRGIRNDVVTALKQLNPPVVRWPGGCFADAYHWRDGIGPRDQRPESINGWGNVREPNTVGTHEFMDFLDQIGARPFISVNVGSGTVQEASDWLEYMTAPTGMGLATERAQNGRAEPWEVPYVGIGNESWGCGGNMYPDTYADEFRKYAAFVHSWSGPKAQVIAVGSDTDDYEWTEVMMKKAMLWRPNPTPLAYNTEGPLMPLLSLHFYSFAGNNWGKKGPATNFGEEGWALGLQRAHLMDDLIVKHSAVMDKYDPRKTVGLAVDEWGTWWDGTKGTSTLYQENTLRDAVIAGMTLNIFHNHADRVRMANIAQTVNVLQAMVLTKGDKMIVTPTWHVFEMYKVHQDATLLPVTVTTPDYVFGETRLPAVSVSASRDAVGKVHVSVVNLDPNRPAQVDLTGVTGKVTSRMLTAQATDAHPAFDAADPFVPVALKGIKTRTSGLSFEVPAKSVTVLEVQ
jgi:alpha-N-arabinofuranosidase